MREIKLLLILQLFSLVAVAARVDTISVYSNAMRRSYACVVIVPEVAAPAAGWPTVYLLHGYGGKYSNWILKVPEIKNYAEEFGMMIVCPDGGFSSWYLDSPVDSSMRYETYVAREIPDFIDRHYPSRKDRQGRAITGLSMGGHGGLLLGIRNQDLFGAAGSMSGAVDLNATKAKYDIAKRMGDTSANSTAWMQYSVLEIVATKSTDSLAMIIDCGTEDFFYESNRLLHRRMLELGIKHDYIERPGKHDWNYWANAVQYQLLFFRKHFN